MKKKIYTAPTIEVVTLETTPILAGSGENDFSNPTDVVTVNPDKMGNVTGGNEGFDAASYNNVWDDEE